MGLFLCRCGQSEEPCDYGNIKRYMGETNALGQKHGNGTYFYSNGDIYDGEWRWDKKHGFGTYTFANGQVRKGFYHEDKFIGNNPGKVFAVETPPESNPATPLESSGEQRNRERQEAMEERLRLKDNKRTKRKLLMEQMRQKYNL